MNPDANPPSSRVGPGLRGAVTALSLLLLAGPVQAQTVLDQSFFSRSIGITVYGSQSWGQSFTTTQAGQLTEVDLPIWRYSSSVAPFNVQIVGLLANGAPDTSPSGLLFSTSIDASQIPAGPFPGYYGNFDLFLNLGDGISVLPGARYAILCSAADSYAWTSVASDAYGNGTALWQPYATGAWRVQSGYDSSFQTWITVPEPTGLLPLGLAVLAFCARKRGALPSRARQAQS